MSLTGITGARPRERFTLDNGAAPAPAEAPKGEAPPPRRRAGSRR